MTVFDRLSDALEKAQAEQDLPNFIAKEISTVLQRRKDFTGRENELEELAEQISLYDTYGQTGYLGMGVNHVILQKTLDRLLKQP
jgi:hypothetical protein